MIYVLHGDDSAASRSYVSTLIGKIKTITLDGRTISHSQIDEHLISKSLFGEEKIIVIENFFSKNKKKKEIFKLISEGDYKGDIVFWEDTKLTPATLNLLKGIDVKAFLLPQYYFQFLDSFTPESPQRVFALYHQLLQNMTSEQIFYSLVKRIRQLTILRMNETKNSKETNNIQDWQLSKLRAQAEKWNMRNLLKFFQTLQETEIKLKSGGLSTELSKHLDILILTQLI